MSWSAGALLIANMGDPIVILRMLAALFSGTWMTILATTTIKDQNVKHRPGKTIILHYTAILGATLHKEGIRKEWLRSGKNVVVFKLQAKDLPIKLEQ